MLSRFQKGLGLLILVALIWVVSSFIVQDILTDHGFGRAFFLTFFANSLFAVNIPLLVVLRRFRESRQQQGIGNHSYSSVTRERSLSASLASVPGVGNKVRADGDDGGDDGVVDYRRDKDWLDDEIHTVGLKVRRCGCCVCGRRAEQRAACITSSVC